MYIQCIQCIQCIYNIHTFIILFPRIELYIPTCEHLYSKYLVDGSLDSPWPKPRKLGLGCIEFLRIAQELTYCNLTTHHTTISYIHAKTNTYSPTSIAKCAHHHTYIQSTQSYPLASLHKHIHCCTIHLFVMHAHTLMRCKGWRERLKKNVRQYTFQVGSSPCKIQSMLTYCVVMSGKHLVVMNVIDLTTFKGIHACYIELYNIHHVLLLNACHTHPYRYQPSLPWCCKLYYISSQPLMAVLYAPHYERAAS